MKFFSKKKKNMEQVQSTRVDINEAFAANLKYISSTEKDTDTIKRQFVKTNTRFYIPVGQVTFSTGKIIVADPLAYLPSNKYSPILETEIPVGTYPVEVSLCRSNEIGIRMCTIRLKIRKTDAISYTLASPTEETAAFIAKDGVLTGFPVDAGMVSICDANTATEYQDFIEKWYKDNPNGNHYDDYFAKFFKASAEKLPQYQRTDGDFIEWENPKTKSKLVMVASGFGDGFYQSYFGYDASNEICELIVPLINPDLFGI